MLEARHLLLLAACLQLAPACRDPTAPRYTSPVDLLLATGAEVRVDGVLRLAFVSVPADSRCPSGAMCFWEGDAAVEIGCALETDVAHLDTLHTSYGLRTAQFAGYTITLLALIPYPTTGPLSPARRYTALLRVERTGR